ncbi:MAG: hypothetical protein JWQ17_7127 [Tardiphaga sp.]|nr:hypothetical protein [Tardiphaga sp.]
MVPAAAAAIALPAAVPPVNAILRGNGCSTIAMPMARPRPVTTLKQPAGNPASPNRAASISVDSGVSSAGLATTVQPAINAAPSLKTRSVIG